MNSKMVSQSIQAKYVFESFIISVGHCLKGELDRQSGDD